MSTFHAASPGSLLIHSCSFFFFGGLSIPVSQAILAHLFSYNMTWGATKKEVERSNFFEEIPKILKRFWVPWTICFILMAGIIILSTSVVPVQWRIDGSAWGVIFPLAIQIGCHILYPVSCLRMLRRVLHMLTHATQIVLNPWLMVFSY